MKTKLFLAACSFLFLSMQCDDDNPGITQNMLDIKKQEILNYINSFSCTANSNCNYIAFGSKPCGGPWEYLAYSSSVNFGALQAMVNEYNQMQNKFNIQTGAISDCMVVTAPNTVGCVNGVCTIIN